MYADLSYFLLYHTNEDRFSKLANTVNPVEHRAKIYVRLRVVTKTVGGRKGCSRGTFRRVKKRTYKKSRISKQTCYQNKLFNSIVVTTLRTMRHFVTTYIALGGQPKYYYYYYNHHRVNILC